MSGSTAMTCRECVEFLMEYLSDELHPALRSTFELHLDRCPNCVRYLETYAATTRLCKSAFAVGEADVPKEVPEDLVQAILAAVRRRET